MATPTSQAQQTIHNQTILCFKTNYSVKKVMTAVAFLFVFSMIACASILIVLKYPVFASGFVPFFAGVAILSLIVLAILAIKEGRSFYKCIQSHYHKKPSKLVETKYY